MPREFDLMSQLNHITTFLLLKVAKVPYVNHLVLWLLNLARN